MRLNIFKERRYSEGNGYLTTLIIGSMTLLGNNI